jgi:hypothetical protein
MIVVADYGADGCYWVSTEAEARAWLRTRQPSTYMPPLGQGLRGDLKAWNEAWERTDGFWDDAAARRAWEDRGRELAIQAQNELGNGWEVFYRMDERVHRVHPPGNWPAGTWEQELLGYPPYASDM